ncbi:MAG: carbon-nitrogen hydrolase family protein [Armatimonadota bacterium]|jgi:predicted amidohydrolase
MHLMAMALMMTIGGAAMAQQGEMLDNPRFTNMSDDGAPAGWEVHTGNPRTAPRYGVIEREGDRWLQFVMQDSAASMGYLSQYAMVPEGADALRLRARVRCEAPAQPQAHALVRVYWDHEPREHRGTPWIYRHFPQWTSIDGGQAELDVVIPVPAKSNRVRLDLMARWSPGGAVSFTTPSIEPARTPEPRIVRLAAVQGHAPAGSSPEDAVAWAVEQVRVAGEKGADLVVLGEAINFAGVKDVQALDVCEPVPDGPMSQALMGAAAEHNVIVCAGIYEQAGEIAYNTAALFGRDGEFIGRYRKVHLPSPEVDWGFTPGDSHPVFDTEIGRVGMQVCYDLAFLESARALTLAGAEIICLPIWGEGRADDTAWPHSPRMMAVNNGVAYVCAVYSQRESCVIDPYGLVLVSAGGEDGVYVADVDLTPHAAVNNWVEEDRLTPRSFRGVWRGERMPETYGPLLDW